MSEYQTIVRPFLNLGVVQKVASEHLAEGQYYDLLNAITVHEGNIQSRFGSARITAAIGSVIHTLDLFRLGNASNQQYLYIGEGNDIYRVRMDALGTVTNLSAALEAWGQRWTGVKANVGRASRPYFFVAASRMMKDSAVTAAGAATTGFEKWGIVPPAAAASAVVGSPLTVDVFTVPSTTTWTADPDESYLFKGTAGVGSAITLRSTTVDLSRFSATVPSGKASNGYDSDDFLELKFTPLNPSRFEQWILQFDVSGAGATYDDYYEKVIVPNQMSGVLNRTSDPMEEYTERSGLLSGGVVGTDQTILQPVTQPDGTVRYTPVYPDTVAEGTKPIELPPSRIDDSGTGAEITVRIAKNEFLKVGKAGTTGFNWANVKASRLWAKASEVGGASLTLKVSSVKLVGGSGPNNADPGLAPYEYAYTYRNDSTDHESNPCPLMVEDCYIKGVRREPVTVSGFVASTDPQVTSLGVYRRGGTLLDFYLVGYTANSTSPFTDNFADLDIMDARSLEFDNDPPVTSSLPTSLMATVTGPIAVGSQTVALTVAQPAGVSAATFLTVGTRLWVQDADRTEQVQITAVSGNSITAHFQLPHSGTIRVTTSSVDKARLNTATSSIRPSKLSWLSGRPPRSIPASAAIIGVSTTPAISGSV